jgi:hypothetical protein
MKIEKRDVVFALLVATIVYMAFRQKKASAQTTTAEEPKGLEVKPNPSNPKPDENSRPVTPYMGKTTFYQLTEDFSRRFPISPSASGSVSFKKGQIIEGKRYSGGTTKTVVIPFGKGQITTTTQGQMPDFQKVGGQAWVQIPESILEPIRPI